MSNLKILCHGSTKIIEKPEFRNGNKYNDYGLGFYCTEELEFTKEWACSDKTAVSQMCMNWICLIYWI